MEALSSRCVEVFGDPTTPVHKLFSSICREAAKRHDKTDRRPWMDVCNWNGISGMEAMLARDEMVEVRAIELLQVGVEKHRRPLFWCPGHYESAGQSTTSEVALDTSSEVGVALRAATSALPPLGGEAGARAKALGYLASKDVRGLPTERLTLKGPRLTSAPYSRPRNPDSAYNLAVYFRDRAVDVCGFGHLGDVANLPALTRHISGWLRQGLTGDQVRAMVDAFLTFPSWYAGRMPWKMFIAKRNELMAYLDRAIRAQEDRGLNDRNHWVDDAVSTSGGVDRSAWA